MWMSVARSFIAACLLLIQSPSIGFDGAKNLFLLEDWPGAASLPPDRYADVFTVSVDGPDLPPMLGQYRIENGALRFAPQFPVQPGVRYRATAKIPGRAPISALFDIRKAEVKPTTIVSRVYPSSNVLPENQLKFYIYFSKPMARGFAYEHVSLLDESGAKVRVPFLELNEELWDPEGRRFTLFFDPGRIKRGLLSQQQLGMALREGKRYTLVIDKGWKDADGNPLAAEFRKTFRAGPADRKPIDLNTWTIKTPVAGGRGSLTILFPKPLDQAILQREVDVLDSSGTAVSGSISMGPEEKSWIFTPDTAWEKGNYSIEVGTTLADLAGNMIGRPFEIDVFEQVDKSLTRTTRTIKFSIGGN